MSIWLAFLLLVATVNPPRRRAELSAPPAVVAAGAALTLVALVGVGAIGDWLLDALDISDPTFQVGVGFVLLVRGVIDLFLRPPGPGDELPGIKAAIVPVFFPVLFRAEVALVALSIAVDGGLGVMTAGAAIGLLLVAGAVRWSGGYERAAGIAFSTVLIVLAIDRLIDGVFAL